MRETERPAASYLEHPTWVGLSRYEIAPGSALRFATRLARENGWSEARAERVLAEYRCFCFLAATAGHKVTPSDPVDQAWHLHLTYSRDYWERFCPMLGRTFHHEPTAGGGEQKQLHFEQYAHTLKSYERIFGRSPPADIWPNAARTLIDSARARRVLPGDGFVLSRPGAALILLIFCAAFLALLLR